MVRSKGAEETFKKGLKALREHKAREALALFEAAVTLASRSSQDGKVDPRYRSYYGLCIALDAGKFRDGLALCRRAAEDEFYNHEVWLNLARVEMETGNKEEAHTALRRGLHLAPRRERVKYERFLEVLGMRRKPFFSFLGRTHALNVLIGRLTWRMGNKQGD